MSADNLPATGQLPPPSLHPVTNARHEWTAVLLGLPSAGRLDDLVAMFDDYKLGDAIGDMACLVPLADPAMLPTSLAQRLPVQRLILLIPISCWDDAAAVAEFERLRGLGLRLMAQGVPVSGGKPPAGVSALAIDAGQLGDSGLQKLIKPLPGPHLALATDTRAGFDAALAAGCNLFAGDYPLHPQAAQQQQGASRALLLKLLGLVASDAESHAIEMLLKQTPDLSYQLLKLVNSVSFSLTNKISNFRQAIAILGRRQLQRWLQLLLYAQSRNEGHNPLMDRAALRASLIEALCKASGGDKEEQERGFMVGMFSLLEALFAMPLEEIVVPLNLSEDVIEALLKRGGRLGAMLALVEQAEHEPAPDFPERLAAVGLTPDSYCRSLVHACQWTIQVNRGI